VPPRTICTGQTRNEPSDGVACFSVQVVDGTILVALVEQSRTGMEVRRWSATMRRAMVRHRESIAGGIALGMTRPQCG
jgi:hypothetical protein